MKKTKIVCTMGPATDNEEILRKLMKGGMDVARFNFSHGTHEDQKIRMDRLKRVREEQKKPIAILLDTKGPEIRTGTLQDGGSVMLEQGARFVLTADACAGTAEKVSITYPGLIHDIQIGGKLLIDDGLIELEVKEKKGADIICTVISGGELGERKGVNVPNVAVRLPALTEQDKEDIRFGVEQGIDFIAASFVRNADCIIEIKALLRECGRADIPVIAKIENAEGIDNIDEIIRASDGIMVARGDLGVEIPPEKVPYLQKLLIQKCNENYKPVITATQMLDSMMRNPRPTRAEVADVANAVYDGTDAVMLSGETAAGKYPVEALEMMAQIVKNAEEHLDYDNLLKQTKSHRMSSTSSALGFAAVATANNLGARCIITPTVSGTTARIVSKFKPKMALVGVSPEERILRRMQIYWGVCPLKSVAVATTEDVCNSAIEIAQAKMFADTGDIVVLTAGIPSTEAQGRRTFASDMMRIATLN